MFHQEYYRLDELGLPLSKVRYLVEQSKLDLHVYVDNLKIVYGGYFKGKGFVGFGYGYYRGLIKLYRNDQLEVLKKSKISLIHFSIVDAANIIKHSTKYNFTIKYPNKYLYDWQPKDLSFLIGNELAGKIYPIEGLDSLRMMSDSIKNYRNQQISDNTLSGEKDFNRTKVTFPKTLTVIGHRIKIEDIVILHDEFERVRLPNDIPHVHPIAAKPDNVDSLRTESAFKRLVKNLIQLHPQKGGTALWDHLYEHHESDESLDPESILDEVGRDELTWIDVKNIQRTITKKTFRNMVSEEKNK
ncbi:hypothetical protein [Paraglaciecola sp. L3A3]|uniref:hypothetical protein n=1 Tax=Paraglaciecola sp. L3A3 TaxID=2686358 RepID=UPI00131DA55C|nr:hypothetical protein [Paraglaciecola sp. L3A3]